MKKILGAAILAVLSPLVCSAELRDAKSVLQQIESAVAQSAGKSISAQLFADIQQFRGQYRQLAPRVAAERWFELLDRARALPEAMEGDPSSIDLEIGNTVGVGSVLASIPAPGAWPEMRTIAAARMKKAGPADLDALALQLLTDTLNNDGAALKTTLAKVEAATRELAPELRQHMIYSVLEARLSVASTYGTPDDVVDALETKLQALEGEDTGGPVQIPDLVGMVGVERATPLLRKAVTSPATVYIQSGIETRRLARQLALENIANMSAAQWALVDTIEAAPLYEAMYAKFGDEEQRTSFEREQADIHYLLSTIVARQQQKAEAALARIARTDRLYLPQSAVNALRDAGQNEALAEFLHAALARQPELRAWDVYIEQSSYAGRSQQALELIRQLLRRADLPAHLRKELAGRETEALLANNQIDAGIKSLRAQIAAKPADEKDEITRHFANAIRLARLGRLLERRDIVGAGLDAARASLSRADDSGMYDRSTQVTHLYGVYRRLGDAAGAQDLALAELGRAPNAMEQAEHFGMAAANTGKRNALIELVGIYTAANRPQDALTVLREARQWGARDLGDFIDQKDSLGMPVGYAAARALADTGDRDGALRVLRVLIHRSPGYDAGYDLLVKLAGPQSIAELDALYLRDQFEERPLIWKAQVLLQARQLQAAEETIRRAIAIDPSDGEQPANDRLRAYAVLADIVDAKGQQKDAAVYRQALQAIRLSERADQFHAVGLYDRALTMYRESLDRFSDAYCIQSRLAIQLSKQGRHQEAVAHYRRAYELMPDSFGRVESHCFGCESVFADANARSIAEEVFTQALQKDREKPQTHYLLGYLRKEQGRPVEALQSFRNAVALDDSYLNAWKQLNQLSELTYIDPAEREIAQLKLLQLDPQQKHVQYELLEVRNLADFWNELDKQQAEATPHNQTTFVLTANARKLDDALARLPQELRAQAELMGNATEAYMDRLSMRDPRRFLAGHSMTNLAGMLMNGQPDDY